VFRKEASLEVLSPENFSAALGLDPSDGEQVIQFRHQGRAEYEWISENYEEYQQTGALEALNTLPVFMQDKLTHITHVIVGLDGAGQDSEYPSYFVGLTPTIDILGFQTVTIWT
jgi:hypothetical protein